MSVVKGLKKIEFKLEEQGKLAELDANALNVALPVLTKTTATTKSTAGNVTYTAAEFLGGLILRDPNGDNRSDVTPTAALLVAALPKATVGATFDLLIRNTADAAETITLGGGTGVTISGTATVAQNNSKLFKVRLTDVTAGTEAATIYSVGTFVH